MIIMATRLEELNKAYSSLADCLSILYHHHHDDIGLADMSINGRDVTLILELVKTAIVSRIELEKKKMKNFKS